MERTIKVNSNTLDEVMDYIVNVLGFVEIKGDHIFKDVHRYYGVTKEDIEKKSKRYEQLVRALVR